MTDFESGWIHATLAWSSQGYTWEDIREAASGDDFGDGMRASVDRMSGWCACAEVACKRALVNYDRLAKEQDIAISTVGRNRNPVSLLTSDE